MPEPESSTGAPPPAADGVPTPTPSAQGHGPVKEEDDWGYKVFGGKGDFEGDVAPAGSRDRVKGGSVTVADRAAAGDDGAGALARKLHENSEASKKLREEEEKSGRSIERDGQPPDYSMEGPFDCFKRADVYEQLLAHPSTRPFACDTGFIESVEAIRNATGPSVDQYVANTAMKDPRMMKAMAALQGWGLSVEEAEVKQAERVGDMPKRDPVQLPNMERAAAFKTPAEAKEGGNAAFKAGEYADALACYLRVIHLAENKQMEVVPGTKCTVHANCAAALLKLERPKEALQSCEVAAHCAVPGQDVTKVHNRAAQAHEALCKLTVVAAEKHEHCKAAVASARMAVTAAKDAEAASEAAGDISTSSSSAVTHLQRELKRHKAAEKEAKEALDRDIEQKARVKEAARLAALGVTTQTADQNSMPLVHRPTAGYVRDIDLGNFATAWLKRELLTVSHTWADGSVVVQALDTSQSDIHASVKEKRGKRAMYYDLTLWMQWLGKSKLGRQDHGSLPGILKMYNIGQDTKFALGGDKETSYMYELGFSTEFHGACAPWADQVKYEVTELFEKVSMLISTRFVKAIEEKANAIK